MSTIKTLVVSVTNEEEGLTATLKTAPDGRVILAPSDPGTYNLAELEAAIQACKEFKAD